MSSVWDRRNRRISYQVPVGVVDLREERVLNTSSINVSRGGIFIDTDEYLLIGAPLMCNLPFGRDKDAMQLRGRVAWLRSADAAGPNRPSGVGIEFVDLSDEQSDKLSTIVGGDEEESHKLSLKLQGLESPVRGDAFLTPKGVFFRSKLPFLSLDSNVEFAFEDDDDDVVYDGRIVGVEVFTDPGSPVPRLQVEVAVEAADMPSPSDIPEGESKGHEYDMLHIDTADTEKTLTPGLANEIADYLADDLAVNRADNLAENHHDDIIVEIPQMMPIITIADDVSGVDDDSGAVSQPIVFELTERVSPLSLPRIPTWAPVALFVGCILGILAFALSGDSAPTTPAVESSTQALADETKGALELPVLQYTPPSAEGAEAKEAAARIRRAALAEQVELGDYRGEAKQAAPAPIQKKASKTPAAKRAQEVIAGVKIWEKDGQLTLRLPIEGSLERAAHYPLADPPGIAVNLPYAQPKAGFHESVSPQHDQLRTIWVRERLGGLHFRAFFDGPAESCEVTFQETALIIRCGF